MRRKKCSNAKGNGEPKQVPKTIENTREFDISTVNNADDEIKFEVEVDKSDFVGDKAKTLITSSVNPNTKTKILMKELQRILPKSKIISRRKGSIKRLIDVAKNEFSNICVINEDQRRPDGLLLIHLPDGPTAYFKLSNFRSCKDIKKNFRNINSYSPEAVITNFTTLLGNRIAQLLGSLFDTHPEFQGKRIVTIHNQRDYIFVRHHWYRIHQKNLLIPHFSYNFQSGDKVSLKELGPRFTLKLQYLQKGTFDSKYADYEWILQRHSMQSSRRKFLL